ncbi:MAG: efflux transporter outer membrane subunit [Betaproteobacteria bacterium]
MKLYSKLRIVLLLTGAAALSACMVGPRYNKPEVTAPIEYKESSEWKIAQPRDAINRGPWWEVFGDQQLNALVQQVEVSNQTVRVAEARLRQAEALVEQTRAGFLPTVTGSTGATRSRTPNVSGASAASSAPANVYNLALSASWAPDLWGSVRSAVDVNLANAQTSAANLGGVRLLAQAQLAINFFQLRALDSQRQLLENTVAAYQKSLDLTRNRYNAGVAARAEVVLAQTQLRSTQAQLIDVGVQRAQLEHAIAILVGKAPADFALPPAPLALTVPVMPPGLPSELLERRPDIAAAERQMAAANAQIGVAQAAYFPTLTLNGVFGFRANTPQNWLVSPSRLWSVGPALAETLFDGGSRDAVKKQAEAAYDANVATYRQTVLNAFKEVEDNLSALRTLEAEAQTQDEAVQSSRLSTELTLNQYKAGTVNYLNVVTVQAMQHNNEATAVKILGQRLVAAVALVQALGGGWNGLTAAPTPR